MEKNQILLCAMKDEAIPEGLSSTEKMFFRNVRYTCDDFRSGIISKEEAGNEREEAGRVFDYATKTMQDPMLAPLKYKLVETKASRFLHNLNSFKSSPDEMTEKERLCLDYTIELYALWYGVDYSSIARSLVSGRILPERKIQPWECKDPSCKEIEKLVFSEKPMPVGLTQAGQIFFKRVRATYTAWKKSRIESTVATAERKAAEEEYKKMLDNEKICESRLLTDSYIQECQKRFSTLFCDITLPEESRLKTVLDAFNSLYKDWFEKDYKAILEEDFKRQDELHATVEKAIEEGIDLDIHKKEEKPKKKKKEAVASYSDGIA